MISRGRGLGALALAACLVSGACSGTSGQEAAGLTEPVGQNTAGLVTLNHQWPLTGLPVDGALPEHGVFAVKIDNTSAAAPQLGLAPEGFAAHQMNALVLTALDFASEVHNTHHPVGVSLYYEDQLPEAKRYSEIFRKERVAKFFGYFERVLKSAATAGEEGWLLDGKMTAADLVLWQVVDGMKFAFPKASARVLKECPALEKHYGLVKGTERIKEYLASERRRKYSKGMFRHYPELDDQEGEK